jgi:AcrR family transcriptional regulator
MSTTTDVAPGGTKRARRSPAQRRDEIARAAVALALDDGLSAITLRAVAARTGVTSALVAHYVPGMEELVASTFTAVVDAELAEVAALSASGGAVARLAALLRTLLDGTRDDVTLVWVEAWALGRRSEPLAAAVRDAMDRWQATLARLVESGIAEGAFHVDDAADAAWQLLGMIDGVNAQSLVRWGGAPDRSALMERAAEGLLGLASGALADAITAAHTTATPGRNA